MPRGASPSSTGAGELAAGAALGGVVAGTLVSGCATTGATGAESAAAGASATGRASPAGTSGAGGGASGVAAGGGASAAAAGGGGPSSAGSGAGAACACAVDTPPTNASTPSAHEPKAWTQAAVEVTLSPIRYTKLTGIWTAESDQSIAESTAVDHRRPSRPGNRRPTALAQATCGPMGPVFSLSVWAGRRPAPTRSHLATLWLARLALAHRRRPVLAHSDGKARVGRSGLVRRGCESQRGRRREESVVAPSSRGSGEWPEASVAKG
jgi:hypothetical protein